MQIKDKSARKINFKQFEAGLALIVRPPDLCQFRTYFPLRGITAKTLVPDGLESCNTVVIMSNSQVILPNRVSYPGPEGTLLLL